MAKSAKIDDITKPEKVAPSATARPIIVTNRPVLTSDPMMVSTSDTKPGEKSDASETTISRSAKTIAPISKDIVTDHPEVDEPKDPAPAEEQSPTSAAEPEEPATPTPTASDTEPAALEAEEPTSQQAESSEPAEPERDVEAEQAATEAKVNEADAERMQQLESLIEKGTYAVPINAVRRKRSRILATIFIVVALVVAVVALDVLLDADILKLPWNVPHTNFL